MKNIHLITTDKASRLLYFGTSKELILQINPATFRAFERSLQNIFITSDEEIKEGDYVCASGGFRFVKTLNNDKAKTFEDDGIVSKQNPLSSCHLSNYKKIILTTDQDLIKDGVQAIDDEFLEWFVKNPSCEKVEIEVEFIQTFDNLKDGFYYKIIIPKEEQKQHLIDMMRGDEELGLYDDSTRYAHNNFNMHETNNYQALKKGYEAGATEMANKMYTEKDLRDAYNYGMFAVTSGRNFNDWFKQLKKK